MSTILRTTKFSDMPKYFGGFVQRNLSLGVVLVDIVFDAEPVDPEDIPNIQKQCPDFEFTESILSGFGSSFDD